MRPGHCARWGAWLAALLLLLAVGVAPDAAPAAPLGQSCSPRPPVGVVTMPGGEGRVQVQVSAGAGAQLTQLRFGEPRPSTNALIDVAEQVGRTGTFTVELAPPAASVTFVVRSAAPGPGATVHLVVRDTCGDWPTFVGAGPAVLGTPAPTVPNTIAVPDGTGSVGWYLSLRLDA